MTAETRCQRAYRRQRSAQVHADAVLRMGIENLDEEEITSLIEYLNEVYDEYRAARVFTHCKSKPCIEHTLMDDVATICPKWKP